jgi:hypothetical protein
MPLPRLAQLCCVTFVFVITFFVAGTARGQQSASTAKGILLSGVLSDISTGESLPGASIYAPAFGVGTVTDIEGNFNFSLPSTDTVSIVCSYVGYLPLKIRFTRNQSGLQLKLTTATQNEVVIDGSGQDPLNKVKRTQMSLEQIDTRQARLLPALFGEVDLLRILQLKPGVQSGGEGTTGLYVRGGGADQNLFLLDEGVIYNPSHLFGFLSVFNPDAVKGIDLYKGNFPAQYGGRLSSVVDVKLREGNTDTAKVSGGIGLVSSRITVEGPIQKKRSSFLFSFRRTYFDVFTQAYNRQKLKENNPKFNPIPAYYFYDANARLTFDLTPRDRLLITGYYGKDDFQFARRNFNFRFDWGNQMVSARLIHRHDQQMSSEASLTYTRYGYRIRNGFGGFAFQLGSGIEDVTAKYSWSRLTLDGHNLDAGVSATNHVFTIGRAQGGSTDKSFTINVGQTIAATEYGAWFSDRFNLGPRTEFNIGARVSGLRNGPNNFTGLEPRLNIRHSITERLSIKAAYGRAFQYLHLVASSGASIPTDLWYPSNAVVKPQLSDQVAAGWSVALGNNQYFFSNEVYYKHMQRQIDFKDGANLFINSQLDTVFVFGKGWAYGTEFTLKKEPAAPRDGLAIPSPILGVNFQMSITGALTTPATIVGMIYPS